LDSEPVTQAPSEAPTPHERLIYYEVKKIGEGAYGRVHKVIKARDGKAFAAKTLNPPPNKNKRRRDEPDLEWLIRIRREFTLMKRLAQKHHGLRRRYRRRAAIPKPPSYLRTCRVKKDRRIRIDMYFSHSPFINAYVFQRKGLWKGSWNCVDNLPSRNGSPQGEVAT
jgi:serine/threonine protein kinase